MTTVETVIESFPNPSMLKYEYEPTHEAIKKE